MDNELISLTKKQRAAFIRIWAASLIHYSDFALDDVKDLDIDEYDKLEVVKSPIVDRLLKEDFTFSKVDEIFDYVKNNY